MIDSGVWTGGENVGVGGPNHWNGGPGTKRPRALEQHLPGCENDSRYWDQNGLEDPTHHAGQLPQKLLQLSRKGSKLGW